MCGFLMTAKPTRSPRRRCPRWTRHFSPLCVLSCMPLTPTLAPQAQLVELPNGDVMANMRNNHADANCSCRAVSVSQDGGVTWGPISYDDSLPEPVCQASIIRSDDVYYFSNPGYRYITGIHAETVIMYTWISKRQAPGPN
jgi:Neuraminidase (sialidase)